MYSVNDIHAKHIPTYRGKLILEAAIGSKVINQQKHYDLGTHE